MKNKKSVLNSFIISRGQYRKLKIAQNKQTRLSNESRTRGWPEKYKSMDEIEQPRLSSVKRSIWAAKAKGAEKMSEVIINENKEIWG